MTIFRILAGSSLLILAPAIAQVAQPPDLGDPRLATHATLLWNNLGNMPLSERLQQAKSTAIRAGIPWTGLNIIGKGNEGAPPGSQSDALVEMYKRDTCQADAIVVGHATASASHLSASAASIYSDYIFVIDGVLKDNTASPIASKRAIVVTRPGGELTLPDGHVSVVELDFPYLETGVTYVEFLKYVPQSTGYQAIGPSSTLRNDNGNLTIARQAFSNIVLPEFTMSGIGPAVASWLALCK